MICERLSNNCTWTIPLKSQSVPGCIGNVPGDWTPNPASKCVGDGSNLNAVLRIVQLQRRITQSEKLRLLLLLDTCGSFLVTLTMSPRRKGVAPVS